MTTGALTSQSQQSFAVKVNLGPSRQDAPAGSAHAPKLLEQLYQGFLYVVNVENLGNVGFCFLRFSLMV